MARTTVKIPVASFSSCDKQRLLRFISENDLGIISGSRVVLLVLSLCDQMGAL